MPCSELHASPRRVQRARNSDARQRARAGNDSGMVSHPTVLATIPQGPQLAVQVRGPSIWTVACGGTLGAQVPDQPPKTAPAGPVVLRTTGVPWSKSIVQL